MIDLHCHLLPALDDGAADLAEALDLADRAVADGVHTVAATPHLRADHPEVDPFDLRERVAVLQAELERRRIPLELVVGGEVDMAWAYRASTEQLRLVSYGQTGRDLLLETPYGHLPPAFEGLIRELHGRGFRVLLAHPERSPTFQHEPKRLAALVADGVLVQIGADSLTQLPRRSAGRRLAGRLIGEGLAHVLATDSHGLGVGRRPRLSGAARVADRLAPGRGWWMTTSVPEAVLAGEPLPAPPARRQFAALRR